MRDDGILKIRVFDPPEAGYPLYEVGIMPFAFLPRESESRPSGYAQPWNQPSKTEEKPEAILGIMPR